MATAVRSSPRTAPALPRRGHVLSDPRHGPLPPLLLALTAVPAPGWSCGSARQPRSAWQPACWPS